MENFDWTKFTRKIGVKSDLQTIYNAWANPVEIEKWFLETATYFDPKGKEMPREQNIKEGYTYKWTWYLYDGLDENKILKANGKDHIQFHFADKSIVDVRLKKEGEYILVDLCQSNIPEDDESKKNVRLGCDTGWSFFLVNLKSFYENGHDLRNKDPKLKAMLNN